MQHQKISGEDCKQIRGDYCANCKGKVLPTAQETPAIKRKPPHASNAELINQLEETIVLTA